MKRQRSFILMVAMTAGIIASLFFHPGESAFCATPAEIQEWLDAHNRCRHLHGVPPVTWSTTLAASAQAWADTCPSGHSSSEYGENMAFATYVMTPTDVVDLWYSEEPLYAYDNPGWDPEYGHFTQVVWESTTQIGCGCKTGCSGYWSNVWLCQYNPPGNYIGQFAENVLPSIPPVGESTFVAGDFNGDGNDDLAGLNSSGLIYYTTNLTTWNQVPGNLTTLSVGDFNNDGHDDLAGLNSAGLIYYTLNLSTWNRVPGTLASLVAGDFNGDFNGDLAGLNPSGEIYYTTNLNTWNQVPGNIEQLITGDFNNDGHDDLAGLNTAGLIYYTTNLTTWNQVPGTLDKLIAGDFNNDGFDGLAGLNAQGHIYYTTNLSTWNQVPGTIADLLSADLNGDGADDLAGLNSLGHIYYTTNLNTWTQIPGTLAKLISGNLKFGFPPPPPGNRQTPSLAPGFGSLNNTLDDDLAGLNDNGHIFYTTNLSTWTQIIGQLAPY